MAGWQAPAGTRLPVTAEIKYNIVARYHFDMGSLDSYVQGVDLFISNVTGEVDERLQLIVQAQR